MTLSDPDFTTTRRTWLGLLLAPVGQYPGEKMTPNDHRPEFSRYFELDLSTLDDVYNPVTEEKLSIRDGTIELTAWTTRAGSDSSLVTIGGNTVSANRETHVSGGSRTNEYEMSGGGVVTRTVGPPYPSNYGDEIMLVFERSDDASTWLSKLSFGYNVTEEGVVRDVRPIEIHS